MLKHIFTLAILSSSVLGSNLDRQLVNGGGEDNTGTDWQYCEDKCNEVCTDCEEHRECGPNEIKCGEGPTKIGENGLPLPLCKKDDICVSDDCECKILMPSTAIFSYQLTLYIYMYILKLLIFYRLNLL